MKIWYRVSDLERARTFYTVEIPRTIRLLDVFDPDGNRLQLSEDL